MWATGTIIPRLPVLSYCRYLRRLKVMCVVKKVFFLISLLSHMIQGKVNVVSGTVYYGMITKWQWLNQTDYMWFNGSTVVNIRPLWKCLNNVYSDGSVKTEGKRDICKYNIILYKPIRSWKRHHVKIPTDKQFHQYQPSTNTSHLKSLNTKPITSYGVWNPGTGLSQSQKRLNG